MKVRNKITGSIMRIKESTWDKLRHGRFGARYEEAEPAQQPEIKQVPKKKKKKAAIEIEDLSEPIVKQEQNDVDYE